MTSDYEVRLFDGFGVLLMPIPRDQLSSLSYVLTANAVGAMVMTLPRDTIPDEMVVPDGSVEIWRRSSRGEWHQEGDAGWLIQTNTRGLSRDRGRYRVIKAVTINQLLARRAVMYYSATYPAVTGTSTSFPAVVAPEAADDLMKRIVLTNLGSSADAASSIVDYSAPTRRWDQYISVDPYTSRAPNVTKQFAWQNVLSTLQDIAKSSASLGVPLYFDLAPNGPNKYVFRTWTDTRGQDRTKGQDILTISAQRGSLGGTIEVTTDWSDLATVVIAGGSGQDRGRMLGVASDASRMALSRFGNREVFLEDGQVSDVLAIKNDALAKLQGSRPVKSLVGNLMSVEGAEYGLNWGFGDKVIAEFESENFIARIDTLTVTLTAGQESISAIIRGET